MADIDRMDQRIKDQLAISEERRRLRQNHVERHMQEWEERQARYTAIADRLMETVIRPRLEKLRSHFENASVLEERSSRHTCCCHFEHTPRFPATVNLEMGITRDGDATTLVVQYKLEIRPIFFPCDSADEVQLALDTVSEEAVAAWVEEKVVAFVETYLQLETMEQYQEDNLVVDPVCGMRVNRRDAPASMQFHGQTYFFCLEECQKKFAENPERYLPRKVTAMT
jgi:YHS domain-containing protein